MSDDKKAAEAAVKTAERAFASAAKKAATALEKYEEALSEKNAAYRTLAYAQRHPALFDDSRQIDVAAVLVAGALPNIEVSGNRISGETTAVLQTESGAKVAPKPTPPQPTAENTGPAAAPSEAEPPADDETPPWEQPPAEEKPAPRRRIGKRGAPKGEPPAAPTATQPPEPTADLPDGPDEAPDDDEPTYYDQPGGSDPLSPF